MDGLIEGGEGDYLCGAGEGHESANIGFRGEESRAS